MSLQQEIIDALGSIAAELPESVVVVVYGSTTDPNGIRQTTTKTITASDMMDAGSTVNTVHVRSSMIAEPKYGDKLTVAGDIVFVTGCRTDPTGAKRAITYSHTRPAQ